jgi:hypothetical protein
VSEINKNKLNTEIIYLKKKKKQLLEFQSEIGLKLKTDTFMIKKIINHSYKT